MKPSSTTFSRRQFLTMTASASLMLAGGIGLAHSRAEAAPVSVTRLLMGSIANLTIIGSDHAHAQAAIAAAFDRMQSLEAVFSRFSEHSQLSQLNRDGSVSDPHPAFVEVLKRAVAYGQLTDGAFDVTIESVHKLYRQATQTGSLPGVEAVEAARQHVDYQAIEIDDTGVRLKRAGMAVTLDGIAKGYIIDQGAAVLKEYGYDNLLVELGGDLSAHGRPESRPWQISIRQPGGSGQALVAQLSSRALATSGDYLNTFTADRRLNHILDPESGVSPLELASASVLAPTAGDADALATALMVMGRGAGLRLAERLDGIEALVITKSGEIQQTAGFPLRDL